MRLLYNIGILIYIIVVKLVAPFNKKARLWNSGRRGWENMLKERLNGKGINIWIHCASLGEFEQGRPLIEAIKKIRPDFRIVLTFFSPSGFEIRKNYELADFICYLPADTPYNAARFISIVNPAAALFIKYEFWENTTREAERNGIPLYLASAIFRENQHFFKWYGGFFRRLLFRFEHVFVQDERSAELLKKIGLENVTAAGDTRFDRVIQIADSARTIPEIELFRGDEKLFLAGSSWRQDEEIITRYINMYPSKMKWIFAPHEIETVNIERLERLFTVPTVRFSKFSEKSADARVMIIDNIGMLSSAYRYAFIAAIGGGFGKGIHNVLEASCWGVPVLIGPNHSKFREAVELIELGGAKCFTGFEDFSTEIGNWLTNADEYSRSSENARRYVRINSGATARILKEIRLKNNWLPF